MPDESGPDRDAPDDAPVRDDVGAPLSRLVRRARRWVAALVAVALLVPAGVWAVDEVRFRLSGTEVIETLEDELADTAVADTVLLVRAAGCEPATDASGSAFVVDTGSGAVLVTAGHVVADARQVGVRTIRDTSAVRVTDVRVSDSADVAVLELADPERLPPALATRRGVPASGTSIRLIGFPGAMPFTTLGTVAEVSRSRLLLDLEVARGASGSPVVDDDGRVVGQVFAVTSEGLGMATPVARLLEAIDDARPVAPC